MLEYLYHCPSCDIDLIHKEPMLAEHKELECPMCGTMAYRIFTCNVKAMNIDGHEADRGVTRAPRYFPHHRNKEEVYVD